MKNLIFSLIILYSSTVLSQNNFCGQYEMEQKYLGQNSSIKVKRNSLEKFTNDYTTNYFSRNQQHVIYSDTILFVIPVVFHIMHDYGAENISKAQILDVMRIINEYFQKTNADTSQIIPLFQPLIGDAQIEFRLAQLDPLGNCTDGITRHQTHLTNGGNDLLKAIIQWPPERYLNIWVQNASLSGFSAYAYLPGSPSWVDGIVIIDEFVGSIGTAMGSINFSLMAHEIGHYLNLWHTWGTTNTPGLATNCNIDDFVFDTPNCIGGVCNLNAIACNGIDTANVQNLMDYCQAQMFTQGQVVRMHAALNSAISNRNNLWTQANLQLTGTNDGYIPVLCPPVADFSNKTIRLCEGQNVTFYNASYGGDFTTINWQFTGGNIPTSTDTNPTVTYNTAGYYDVTLTVTNSSGTSTVTRNVLVEVTPAVSTAVPFAQDFETINFPFLYWNFENISGSNWQTTNLASVSGTKSIYLQNDSANFGTTDIFYTENFNLSNITSPIFNFKVAFANRGISNDNLKVFISTDCGQTWTMKYTKSGNSLETVNDTSQNFIPTQTQWRQDGMNISTAVGQNNVRFKFQFTSDGGNNIFIDDINISGVTGVNSLSANDDLIYVYPTVATTSITIKLKAFNKNFVFLKDMLGRELKNFSMSSEKQLVNIENIEQGVYIIEGISENKKFTAKFIKASNE
ncbi:MAG: PKD domain-containing protein [Bacteroidetes bacterium]|nr:PKD domain-containing protein [Bacteroidota bacterium]